MPPVSAGCIVTRRVGDAIEILLVHPKGAGFRRPLFGIPKGTIEAGEDPKRAASRETLEETGLHIVIRADLGSVRQKSGKIVHGFWATVTESSHANIDERGRCRNHDGENDVCRFYKLAEAAAIMIPAQREFIPRLIAEIERAGGA